MARAKLSVAAVNVGCPHCGTLQGDPDGGSHMWSPEQLAAHASDVQARTCQDCGGRFTLYAPARVTMENRAL